MPGCQTAHYKAAGRPNDRFRRSACRLSGSPLTFAKLLGCPLPGCRMAIGHCKVVAARWQHARPLTARVPVGLLPGCRTSCCQVAGPPAAKLPGGPRPGRLASCCQVAVASRPGAKLHNSHPLAARLSGDLLRGRRAAFC
jgi:hypothetical protein